MRGEEGEGKWIQDYAVERGCAPGRNVGMERALRYVGAVRIREIVGAFSMLQAHVV